MRPGSGRGTSAVVAAIAVALAAAPAAAGPRRSGMFGGAALDGDLVSSGDRTGAGFGFAGHLGWILGDLARFAVEAEGVAGESWVGGAQRIDAVLLIGARLWPADRVSLSVGLGVTAGDGTGGDGEALQLVGGGSAIGASLGVDLVHWRTSALTLHARIYSGEFDDARATHVGLTFGFEGYGLTSPTPR